MNEKPIECPLCRIGKYPHFSYSGSGACDHCGAVWTYDEGDTLTEDSLRRLWEKVPRWIPVGERLPEHGDAIWVYGKDVFMGEYWQGTGFHSYGASVDREGLNSETLHGVTHWMEIDEPEPPEVK